MADLGAGLLAGGVTAVGWFATHYLIKRREDSTRRLEVSAKYLERQLEEFYGPLFNLLHQLFVANHVQEDILRAGPRHGLSEADAARIRRYFRDSYFMPIHDEINQILKTRLYLIEGTELPESYYEYLRHAIQERVQTTLWERLNIGTSYVTGREYPQQLYTDIKNDLDAIMLRYARLTKALGAETATFHRPEHEAEHEDDARPVSL
jgi:hypothetical protein